MQVDIIMKNITILILVSFLLPSCGGGSKLSLEEAESITLNYQGANYTPPPRGVDKIISEIELAGAGLVQEHTCKICDALDVDDPDISTRLENLSKLAIVSHMRGNSQKGVEYIKRAVALLESAELDNTYSKRQRLPLDHDYFSALHRAAQIAMEVGNYSDSVRFINKAIRNNKDKLKPYKGKFLYQYAFLAAAYAELGDIDEAESALETGENYFSEIKKSNKRLERFALLHQQMTLITKGIIQNGQGNLREAEEYFRQTVDLMEEHSQGRKGWTWRHRAKVMGPYLVGNLLAQNRIAEAEAQAIVAIRYSLEKFGYEGYVTATMLQSYVKVLIARERYDDARKMIKVTEHILEKIGALKSSLEWIKLQLSLADIYIADNDWSEAKRIYQKIYQDLASEPEVRKGVFYENLNWAVILAFNNNLSDAEKIANAVVEKNSLIFGPGHIYTAEAKGVLAMIKASGGQKQQAQELFENMTTILVAEKDSNQSNGVNQQRIRLILETYLDLLYEANKSGDPQSTDRAFYIAQLISGRNVQNAVSSSAARASIKDPELIKLVRKEQDAMRKIEAGYNKLVNNQNASGSEIASLDTDIKSRVDKLAKARESILEEINNRFPDYDNMVRPQPVSADKAKSVLAPDEALIMTYSGTNNLYVWTLLADGRKHFNQAKINRNMIMDIVSRLRKGLDMQVSTLNDIPDFDVTLSHQLYNVLLRSSAHLWRSSKTMSVIADGPLASLPFTVLVTEEPGKLQPSNTLRFTEYRSVSWLANKYATSYTPSVSTLINLRNLKLQQKPGLQFAGFGNPSFGGTVKTLSGDSIQSRGAVKLSMRGLRKTKLGSLDNNKVSSGNLSMLVALPDTADEVLKVAAALKVSNQGNVFLGNDANEHRVKNMPLNNRRVLMFATHALLPGDLDGLVQPAIALSASKGTERGNDGLLTMGEVMGLDLNADWVVLSACNTGAASGRGATAVSGLGQAFFYAGARSLLVSHWPVETTSAKEITTGLFDRQVSNPGLSRAEALNETLKDLVQNKNYKNDSGKNVYSYAHPVFWAPFTIVGNGAGTIQ